MFVNRRIPSTRMAPYVNSESRVQANGFAKRVANSYIPKQVNTRPGNVSDLRKLMMRGT